MGYNIFFESDGEAEVSCDAVKIEQVITNLINNAINFTGEDKNVFIKQINQDDGVRIEIRDTGQGIDEEKIKLIFDKYYRSENHKRSCRNRFRVIYSEGDFEKHNFAYGVQSTIGKGSVFWFKLRLADKADENIVEHRDLEGK